MLYYGIELSEGRLLANNIAFSFIFIAMIVISIFAYFVFRDKQYKKNVERIKALKEKAVNDPIAEKRLRKMERKHKHLKNYRLKKILSLALIVLLTLLCLFVAIIPGWTDYIKKDYIVYGNGLPNEYVVHSDLRKSTVILQDGTVLYGSSNFDDGTYHGKIVYAKRSKFIVGIEKTN